MNIFLTILFFIIGACIISFLKVIAHDYPEISFTRRSHCDHCGRILRWFEIIPLVGYFIAHGKCFRCKNQISFDNPLMEFFSGLLFVALLSNHDWWYLPFCLMLMVLGYSDAFYGYIYPIFYLLAIPTIINRLHQLHFLIGIVVYLSLFLLSRKYELGLGDIEVLSLIALVSGIEKLLWITLLACSLCLILFWLKKKRSFRFIPYLSVATGIIYLIFSFYKLGKIF